MMCQSGIVDDWEGIRSWYWDLQRPLARMMLPNSLPLVLHPDDVRPCHVLSSRTDSESGVVVLDSNPGPGFELDWNLSLPNSDPGPDGQHYPDSTQWHLRFHQSWEKAMCYYSTRNLIFVDDWLAAL
jgi:hypothetical protein